MRSRKAIKNICSSLLLQIVTLICGFITPILIIKNYGSNVNGLVSSIAQFLAYISFLDAGFGPVLKSVLYKPLAEKNNSQISGLLKSSQRFFRRISFIFIIYIIVLACIYPYIVIDKFDFLFTFSLVLIISISTFFEYYFGITYKLFINASQKTYVTSNIRLIFLIINTIIIVILVNCGVSIILVKLISSLIYVFRPIVQNIYVNKKYKLDIKNAEEIEIKQKWIGLSQHIAAVVHASTDVTILTLFAKNISIVSVYSVYYMVVGGIKKIIESITGGMDASFGDMYAKGEKEVLNKSFKMYELFYHTITTIVFTCCLILIVPFVSVYTKNISDVNYIIPSFAYVLVISELVYSIRLPYSSLTKALGHFKETMVGAWVETIVNVLLSIILVIKYGIVGVAIGTLVSMIIRTSEFMYHTSKHILNRSLSNIAKRLIIIGFEVVSIMLICKILPSFAISNYTNWIIRASLVFIIACIIVVLINYICYRDDFQNLISLIKKNIKFAHKKEEK